MARLLSRPLWTAVIGATLVVGAAAGASSFAARSPFDLGAKRPVVLLLHGRGQLGRDTADIRARWFRSLETGLGKLTSRPLIDSGDVRLVWYADLLDPTSPAGCDTARGRALPDSNGDRGDDALQLLLGFTSTLLTSLFESMPADSRDAMRSLVGDVLYLGDRWRRCAVDRRLESALLRATQDGRPVILVAHSFGSLVAYSYLRNASGRSAPAVHRYVTLGSMLGIPDLQQLLLGHADSLAVPAHVRSWVNVRHVRDPFAAPLAGRVGRGQSRLREVVTSSAAVDPHDIVSYLRDDAAARAIAWAWCDAGGKAYAPGCRDVRTDVPADER